MENEYVKISIFKNIGWKLFERGASLIVTFVVNIVLARLLDPSDFGLAAMVAVFVTLSTVFVTSGVGNALIQKKDADELDFSSMFWMNLCVSIVFYLLMYAAAPMIARFYNFPNLTPMLRILSLNLLMAAINSIQGAYISKNMMFRYYFYSTLSGKIASGIVGVCMALLGFGVWSLIGLSLSSLLFETCILWLKVKWRPQKKFSWERAKNLYSFTWKITFMSFTEAIGDQLRNMFIGKKYSSTALAYYDKGNLLPNNIVTNIASSLSAVMFPVLSHAQDNPKYVLALCRRWTGVFAYCTFPLLTGIIMAAKPLITIILSEKWLLSVPYLQLACGVYAVWIVEIPIRETIKSYGYAKICLKMQVIKTVFALAVLLLVMNHSVIVIAISAVGCGLFNILVSMFYGNKYAQYKPMMIFKDLAPTLVLSLLMGACIYTVFWLALPDFIILMLQATIGIAVYIAFSIVTKNKNFSYVNELAQEVLKKNHKTV